MWYTWSSVTSAVVLFVFYVRDTLSLRPQATFPFHRWLPSYQVRITARRRSERCFLPSDLNPHLLPLQSPAPPPTRPPSTPFHVNLASFLFDILNSYFRQPYCAYPVFFLLMDKLDLQLFHALCPNASGVVMASVSPHELWMEQSMRRLASPGEEHRR